MVRLKGLAGSGSLARLRIGFVGLGVLLLGPLALLMASANERLEGQRRLRHQVVGERIFDELERELTELLRRESQRPSAAYEQDTTPEAWAPFIVGYFTATRDGVRCVAEERLDADRRRELDVALPIWFDAFRAKPSRPAESPPRVQGAEHMENAMGDAAPATEGEAPAQASTAPAPPVEKAANQERGARKSSPEVLQMLNRAPESRVKRAPSKSDPMQDYSVGY